MKQTKLMKRGDWKNQNLGVGAILPAFFGSLVYLTILSNSIKFSYEQSHNDANKNIFMLQHFHKCWTNQNLKYWIMHPHYLLLIWSHSRASWLMVCFHPDSILLPFDTALRFNLFVRLVKFVWNWTTWLSLLTTTLAEADWICIL